MYTYPTLSNSKPEAIVLYYKVCFLFDWAYYLVIVNFC